MPPHDSPTRAHRHRDSHRSRSMSRSPSPRYSHSPDRHRSHHRHGHKHHDSRKSRPQKRKRARDLPAEPVILPLHAQPLTKHDLRTLRPLFASYLDIQKEIFIEDLSEDEIRGRWKSFMGRWNRGELAEGWYDPATLERALEAAASYEAELDAAPTATSAGQGESPDYDAGGAAAPHDSDDEYGPTPPPGALTSGARAGPSVPTFADLAERDADHAADALASRSTLRHERKVDRKQQRERLDELVPRAEPGTRERQLEKRRETAATLRSFRDAKAGAGEMEEVGEGELLGEGGGVDDVKRIRKEQQRKKNERELRREEVLRARAEEREERLRGQREKEAKTMEALKALAQERFG